MKKMRVGAAGAGGGGEVRGVDSGREVAARAVYRLEGEQQRTDRPAETLKEYTHSRWKKIVSWLRS